MFGLLELQDIITALVYTKLFKRKHHCALPSRERETVLRNDTALGDRSLDGKELEGT